MYIHMYINIYIHMCSMHIYIYAYIYIYIHVFISMLNILPCCVALSLACDKALPSRQLNINLGFFCGEDQLETSWVRVGNMTGI